ncbi:hypothetical protein ALI44B_00915 [Leifsonia sp. ALI-44-B]|uniref:toll/interleukin-1 receptor domain-containing protein n=1 Tax=Leifsonia sp. ALI-44-B TaxID=1933776 RepID=UPI00097BCCA2|nr:TIR domain-containing protein [Leifsonia sp. ALI-44-B]ONI65287.1 hypothetical protein ALI44B_00915 [Leifsonia sp. ALI-44-B]
MKVFISWSGAVANAVAIALKPLLTIVSNRKIETFISSEDIKKGSRGLPVIADELELASFGIVVVTAENMDTPWINFEAGALGKSVLNGRVAPLLVGLQPKQIAGPLKQFQAADVSVRDEILGLVREMNEALAAEDRISDDIIVTMFDREWPKFEAAVKTARDLGSNVVTPSRSDSEILTEVLSTVRDLQREVTQMRPTVGDDRGRGVLRLRNDRIDTETLNIIWSLLPEASVANVDGRVEITVREKPSSSTLSALPFFLSDTPSKHFDVFLKDPREMLTSFRTGKQTAAQIHSWLEALEDEEHA